MASSHELSQEELRLTNLVTTDMAAQPGNPDAAVVEVTSKRSRHRLVSSAVATETNQEPATQAAEANGWTAALRAATVSPGRE